MQLKGFWIPPRTTAAAVEPAANAAAAQQPVAAVFMGEGRGGRRVGGEEAADVAGSAPAAAGEGRSSGNGRSGRRVEGEAAADATGGVPAAEGDAMGGGEGGGGRTIGGEETADVAGSTEAATGEGESGAERRRVAGEHGERKEEGGREKKRRRVETGGGGGAAQPATSTHSSDASKSTRPVAGAAVGSSTGTQPTSISTPLFTDSRDPAPTHIHTDAARRSCSSTGTAITVPISTSSAAPTSSSSSSLSDRPAAMTEAVADSGATAAAAGAARSVSAAARAAAEGVEEVIVAGAGWRVEVGYAGELTEKKVKEGIEEAVGVPEEGMKMFVEGKEVGKEEGEEWKEAVRGGEMVRVVEMELSEKPRGTYVGDQYRPAGFPYLHDLVARNRERAVVALLRRGVDTHTRDNFGENTRTALHWAAKHGSWRIVTMLIGAGAPLEVYKYDGTALCFACDVDAEEKEVRMRVEALLSHGAEVNAVGHNVDRPVHRVVEWMRDSAENGMEVLRAVVASGADLHVRRNWGETPLMMARRSRKERFAEELRRGGATY